MRAWLAGLSEVLNRMAGGKPGETLCARMARSYGVNCLFCRYVSFVLREPDHCARQLED